MKECPVSSTIVLPIILCLITGTCKKVVSAHSYTVFANCMFAPDLAIVISSVALKNTVAKAYWIGFRFRKSSKFTIQNKCFKKIS